MSLMTRRPRTPDAPRAVGPVSTDHPHGAPAVSPRDTAAAGIGSSVLLFLALAIALAGLSVLLTGVVWWLSAAAAGGAVLGAAAVARLLVRRRSLGTLVALVVGVAAITVMFASDTAALGVIPTADSLERFRELTALGISSINEQASPAVATPGILFIVAWTAAALALVLDAVANWWRAPALAGVPLLVLLTVPSIVDVDFANPVYFVLVAAVYLLLLRPRLRRIQSGVALGVGVVAVGIALLAPVVLPPVSFETTGRSGNVATGVNPIISLGDDLRRGTPTTALTYTNSEGSGQYLRLTTLEEFSGREWEPGTVEAIPGNDVAAIGVAPGLSAEILTVPTTTSITVDNAVGRWLPVPYPATSITGLEGDWYWEPDGLSVRSTEANMRGQEYEVASIQIEPTTEQLAAAADSSSSPLAQVPDGLDPIVAETAAEVVGNATTDYAKALALQSWFRSSEFTYSEDAPVEDGFDGSGLDVLVPFLEAKAGYCVHYSSAMAIMARTLGIPSRVVVGFLPGEAMPSTDDTRVFTVSSRELHAWPELFFEGTGWVRFEPTPGRGTVPVYLSGAVDNPNTPDVVEGQPSAAPSAGAVPTTAPTSTPTTGPGSATGSSGSDAVTIPWVSLLIALAVVVLLLAPALVRLARRSRRYTQIAAGTRPATAAWLEIVDTARDLGIPGGTDQSPRRLEALLAEGAPLGERARECLAELRLAVEREAYAAVPAGAGAAGVPAPTPTDVSATSLDVVLGALRARAGVPARLRAAVLPRTVLDLLVTGRLPTSN